MFENGFLENRYLLNSKKGAPRKSISVRAIQTKVLLENWYLFVIYKGTLGKLVSVW